MLRAALAIVLQAMRRRRRSGAPRPRFVYASAGVTLCSRGGGAGAARRGRAWSTRPRARRSAWAAPTDWVASDGEVSDATRATPHTTYGMTKACGELLLADYSRRGFVDGRGVRLPSVVVRAGAPNAATTGVYSGVVRETHTTYGMTSPIVGFVEHAVAGARSAVASLVAEHDAPAATADAVLGHDRAVFLRSTAVSSASVTKRKFSGLRSRWTTGGSKPWQ